jgi:hypothetical protein
MSDGLILTEDNEDLFDTRNDTGDFDPPSLFSEKKYVNSEFMEGTPVIKFMTPVKKNKRRVFDRREDDDEDDEDDEFKVPEPVPFSPFRSPKVDLTDDDDINEHVRKLVSCPRQIDYENEPDKIKELCEEVFRSKIQTLRVHYPEYEPEYPEEKSLNKIHKYYHELIKSIYINMNIGQYETWYLIALLAAEVVFVQVFNIPFGGYTKSELKRMYRKKSMLIELGESWYPTGEGEKSSIEYRLASDMFWNMLTFIAVKIMADWVGGDEMIETCRAVVEKLMDSHITTENIETGEARNIEENEGSLTDNILGNLTGMGGNLKDIIVEMGSQWTEKSSKDSGKGKKKKKNTVVWGE